MTPENITRFFRTNVTALRCIQHTLREADLVRISTAYFEASGYQALQDILAGVAMQAICCGIDEPKAPDSIYPDDDGFDAWIERARQNWARWQNVPVNK